MSQISRLEALLLLVSIYFVFEIEEQEFIWNHFKVYLLICGFYTI
jgi:hypothetical protein